MKIKQTTVDGTSFLTLPNDVYIGKSLELYGEWSHGEVEIMSRLVPKNGNVLEAGSNIGSHTVFIGRDICSQGKVYAFEPRRIPFQLLCANLALNGVGNAHCFHLGAGAQREVMFEAPLPVDCFINAGGYALGQIIGEGEKITVVPLDDMRAELDAIALLKGDIQGYELSMLKGARRLIERDRPVLYLENDVIESSEALLGYIDSLGYDTFWHSVPAFRANNRSLTQIDIFPGLHSLNVLCFPCERRMTMTKLAELGVSTHGLTKCEGVSFHPLKPR